MRSLHTVGNLISTFVNTGLSQYDADVCSYLQRSFLHVILSLVLLAF